MKKSKVLRAKPNGTWDGQHGTYYKFEIEMANGDIGEYSSKSKDQTKFVVGQETEYEFTDGKFPKIKPVSNFQPQANYSKPNDDRFYTKEEKAKIFDGKDLRITRLSCLNRAVDMAVAEGVYTHENILKRANVFVDWVYSENKDSEENLPFS